MWLSWANDKTLSKSCDTAEPMAGHSIRTIWLSWTNDNTVSKSHELVEPVTVHYPNHVTQLNQWQHSILHQVNRLNQWQYSIQITWFICWIYRTTRGNSAWRCKVLFLWQSSEVYEVVPTSALWCVAGKPYVAKSKKYALFMRQTYQQFIIF